MSPTKGSEGYDYSQEGLTLDGIDDIRNPANEAEIIQRELPRWIYNMVESAKDKVFPNREALDAFMEEYAERNQEK